ncbi:uncharacterized protein [Gossypium hirsutum]|uniref:Uncharacterized protein n=1 Tax=Gossypium hirsutum TaxID=3635 RepID=A0ABM3BLK8_GOSHI|nr:uncharacterized protein LOC121228951 [Gossypium hirsutum]
MNIIDYEREFLCLSKYTPDLVLTDEAACKRFRQILRVKIKFRLASHKITEIANKVERAKMVEQAMGLDKEKMGDKAQGKRPIDCPKSVDVTSVSSQRSTSTPQSRGSTRGGVSGRGSQGRVIDSSASHAKATIPARVYTIRTRGEGDATDVVSDPCSTYSYMRTGLINIKKLIVEIFEVRINFSNPIGHSVKVNQVCRWCPIEIQGKIFLADLLLMPFDEFDVILRMDWLSEHGVIIDCWKKNFKIQVSNGEEMEVKGMKPTGLAQIILTIKADKLIYQGCETFLSYVINLTAKSPKLEENCTVCEFSDVFSEELPRLPPDREVEFAIKVYPRTTPVCIAPYRMSLKELKELKVQLQDLLDQGFIQPSV